MYQLLLLSALLDGGVHAESPLQLDLTTRVGDTARMRSVPARCVERSVTAVSCADVTNSDALMAHPDDYQLFYYCEAIGDAPTCRQCPAGLHFNPTLHVCDWPQNANCTAQPPTTTIDPTTNPTSFITVKTSVSDVTTPAPTSPSPNGQWVNVTVSSNTAGDDKPQLNTTTFTPSPSVTSSTSWPSNVTWPWWPSNTAADPVSESTTWSSLNNTEYWPSNTSWWWWATDVTDAAVSDSSSNASPDTTTTSTPRTARTTRRWKLLN